MLSKVVNAIKEGTFFEKVKHKFNVVFKTSYIKYVRKNTPVDPKKVMFLTFQGKYSCNPKAVAEEFIKRNLDYKLVWVVKKENLEEKEMYPKELKLVVSGSREFYKEIASSKYIIENANDTLYLKYNKKPGQVYIQCWHGSLGFKRLDTVKNEKWVGIAKQLGEETDYCISNSSFETEVFRTSYWENNTILEYGHPRNDVLLDEKKSEQLNKEVRDFYNIPKDKKIILYAPTFRDDFDFDTYNLDYKAIHKAFEERFKCECVFMLRFHFKLRNVEIPKEVEEFVINATDYYDMQDLLCAADYAITDYSSWLCDFVLTKKPGFLYTNDIEKYVDERGFYYPLSETPFPIAENNEEFVHNILNFDEKKYEKERKRFLKDRGCVEKGDASKKVVDLIINNGKKKIIMEEK